MNALWLQYITVVLQVRKDDLTKGIDVRSGNNQTSICSKLVKADFSGAEVKVIKSKDAAMIGTKGIIVRETARAFILIQKGDVTKLVPKESSVF